MAWDTAINRYTKMCYNQEIRIRKFDSHGNVLILKFENWDNDTLTNHDRARETYTYDTQGNNLTQEAEDLKNKWINTDKISFTYDIKGNMLTAIEEILENNALVKNSMNTYTYNSKGNKLTSLGKIFRNNMWVNIDSTSYTYDVNEKLVLALRYGWKNQSMD